ncbi:unnamed protein product [Agarophyton chilense]
MLNINESDQHSIASPSSDGSELFPRLWRYFLRHQHIRDWLMRKPPYCAPQVNPASVKEGVGFCCNFSTPEHWSDMGSCFEMGEMFIPDHQFRNFMCGSVIAASPFHKHLICALGSAAARHSSILASYKTQVRRMVVDMRSAHAINLLEFSWMEDGMLIVMSKVLVPPISGSRRTTSGCSGAFALFNNTAPGGNLPTAPISFVSFVEAPLCPSCTAQGSLGCHCPAAVHTRDQNSSSTWPLVATDSTCNPSSTTMQNLRMKLASIRRISHVKVTAHIVTPEIQYRASGMPIRSYKLGPSRFIIKAADFRPSTPFESDTLRQVADKWRLLRIGSLRILSFLAQDQKASLDKDDVLLRSKSGSLLSIPSTDLEQCTSENTLPSTGMFEELIRTDQYSSSFSEDDFQSSTCKSCGRSNESVQDGSDLSICACMLSIGEQTASSCESYETSVDCEVKRTLTTKSSNRPKCDLCGKEFSQQGSLNRHMRNIHEEKKIPCQYCSMSFGQMFDLRRHQKRKHPDRNIALKKCERIETKVYRRPMERLKN